MKNDIATELCEIASTLRIMEAVNNLEHGDEYLSIVAGSLAKKLEEILEYF